MIRGDEETIPVQAKKVYSPTKAFTKRSRMAENDSEPLNEKSSSFGVFKSTSDSRKC